MLSLIEKLLGVVGKLFGLRDSLLKAKAERRDKMLDLLDKIAACLDRVVTELEGGKVPHGACAELAFYAGHFPEVLGEEVGQEVAVTLAHELQEAHNVEGLFMALQGVPDPKAELAKLWESSGRMHALVNLLKSGWY